MPNTRTLSRLTEDWPDSPDNFELQGFVATLREERVELSPPALDRIEAILSKELDRQLQPRVVPAARWSYRIGSAVRLAFPYAVAASLLIASCVWVETRVLHPRAATLPQTSPAASLITDRPKNLQPALPEDPAPSPIPAKPQGG